VLELNRVYCGSNTDLIEGLDDNSVDLTVTSPPYDDLRSYKEFTWDFELLAKELYRVTKEGGVVVWVVNDQTVDGSETGTSFRQALYFMECGFRLHDTMIYEKPGAAFPSKVRYSQVFEFMFVFSKGKPKSINLIKDHKNRWAGFTNFGSNTSRQKDGTMKENPKVVIPDVGTRFNCWVIHPGYKYGHPLDPDLARKHPATFPASLARDHIISWSNENDVILDPFAGSGTTLVEAMKLGRNYIGFEIAKEYVELCYERLQFHRGVTNV
jgi:DNA modification methylase